MVREGEGGSEGGRCEGGREGKGSTYRNSDSIFEA
jgi:hypothetical protein